MAPTFRAAGAVSSFGATSRTSITAVAPTCQSGDLLLAFVSNRSGAQTVSAAGWSQVLSYAPDQRFTVLQRRFVTGDSGASFTFAFSGSDTAGTAAIVAYSSAVSVDATGTVTGTGLTRTAPQVTTTRANETIIEAWTYPLSGRGFAWPYTVRVDYQPNDGNNSRLPLGIVDHGQSTAGASSPGTAQISTSGNNWAAVAVALASNVAPNAPALTAPANNATLDRTVQQRFSWTFSDPDTDDTQSKADIRFSSDNGSTWTTYTANSPNGYYDLPASTLAAGAWQWQVRTYDSQVVVGPWSGSQFFTMAAPANAPIITYPTSGGTVNQSDRVDWSFSSPQQSFQVQRVADNAGAINTGTVYFDTGEVVDTSTRTQALSFPTNNRYEWIRVRVKSSGLWTSWTSIRVQVSYTPPPAPTVWVQPVDEAAAIDVTWASPAPGSGQPPATYAEVWISSDGGATATRVAKNLDPSGTWRYATPASRIDYTFRVLVRADNGIANDSGWVGGNDQIFGGGTYGTGVLGT